MKSMANKLFYHYCLISIVIFLVCSTANVNSQNRELTREDDAAKTQKRLALVIGNGSYETSPLRNPVNDANDMAAALRSLGFEVEVHTDINQNKMKRAISSFGRKLRDRKATGLFYFAGHGVQVRGKNYLIPVGAKVDTEEDVEYEGVDVGRLLAQMRSARNSMNIVILDACRNNPFARSFRSGDKGLASIDAPSGTIIAYATAPGSVAADGEGRNGLYTEELLKQIKEPGLSIESAFKRVRVAVQDKTDSKQTPWESSSLTGDFYFAGKQIVQTVTQIDKTPESKNIKPIEGTYKNALTLAMILTGLQSKSGDFTLEERLDFITTRVKQSGVTFELNTEIETELRGAGANENLIAAIRQNLPVSKNTETIKAGTIRKNLIGMELVYIPAGEFMMGSSESEVDEAFADAKRYSKEAKREWYSGETPQRKITIREGFWMGKYEVTQEQYEQIMGKNPSNFKKNCGAKCPVEQVSWNDAKDFIRKLNSRNDGFTYSLPTEAEWEYAARAGTTTAFAFGNSLSSSQANFDGNRPYGGASKGTYLERTTSVGSYQPNKWGLYDMHGNIIEWVEDIYNNSYRGLPTDGSANMSVGDSDKRVLRGGTWRGFGVDMRSAVRGRNPPSIRYYFFGFRVAARPSAL